MPDAAPTSPAHRAIVGIGASAGGIEAMQGLLQNMPADAGLSLMIVQHLSPDRPSLLADILQRWTAMPVRQALDGMAVEPDAVYVVPPNAIMTIRDAVLNLRLPSAPVRETTPIDIFFSSLAEDQGTRAIGIVLSGTGSDGTLGLKAIRDAGGTTLAQGVDGSAPQYDGMPNTAVAAGSVDLAVPVEKMPAVLLTLIAREPDKAPEQPVLDAIAAVRLDICTLLHRQVGHDFSHYKQPTFLRRVHRRIEALHLDATAYLGRLQADPTETGLLFRDLLIGVTGFFRDTDTFEKVERDVLPRLFDAKLASDTVRIWVPGCATGEEAYTLAMLCRERMKATPRSPRVQIFATDIDEPAIGVARAGRYPRQILKGVSQERIARFFNNAGDSYVAKKEIRDLCTFSSHSVIRDPPYSRMDLVSCRNLLIYLDSDLQRHVLPAFHYALAPGGHLMLGGSETVTQGSELFEAVDKRHRIYRRLDVPSPKLGMTAITTKLPARSGLSEGGTTPVNPSKIAASAAAYMLDQFAPAFVVVGPEGDVVHYSAGTGRFLEAAAGAPNGNLMAMARRGLRAEVRAALRQCAETGERVERQRVAVESDGGAAQHVTLTVERLSRRDPGQLYIVVFADAAEKADSVAAPSHSAQDITVERLERELRDNREQLQSTVEEYETAVEELKSTNEELHSVNEELQSTVEELETAKEETQSTNEELHTVNAQLTEMVEELDRANCDLRNLFDSTAVATVFLDRDMRLRGYTPAMTAIFNLIPSDHGRRLTDIVSHVEYDALRRDAANVLEGHAPFETRVTRKDGGAHYLMRILPYHASDNRINGVLVTFIDVTGLVTAEQHQRLLVDELNHRVKNMLTVVVSIATQTLNRSKSLDGFSESFLGRLRALGTAYSLLSRENWTEVAMRDLLLTAVEAHMTREPDNFSFEGPTVFLKPRGALALGLAAHELATNAVKYGALSVPEGRVDVGWRVADGHLDWFWAEHGGPKVTPPAQRGFGTTLLERSLAHELNARVEIGFPPTGLRMRLAVPLDPQLIGLSEERS